MKTDERRFLCSKREQPKAESGPGEFHGLGLRITYPELPGLLLPIFQKDSDSEEEGLD